MVKKSQLTSFILTLLFGPLGLFYSTIAGAIAMIVAAILFGSITLGLALLIIWPLSILLGIFAVMRHNKQVRLQDRRHDELVQATRQGATTPADRHIR